MPRHKHLLPDLAEELSKKGYQKAVVSIRSRQLRRSLSRQNVAPGSWVLHIPQYWAVYLNDGRGPVVPRKASFLVWFRNPKNDPRLNAGRSPIRLAETRRLSKAQFQYWAAKNREIIKRYRRQTGKRILTSADYEAMKLPMIVVKMSPKHGGSVPGQHFFDNDAGMQGFKDEASQHIQQRVGGHVLSELSKFKLLGTRKITVLK